MCSSKYAVSASEALLVMDPIVFRQMREHVRNADETDTEAADWKPMRR